MSALGAEFIVLQRILAGRFSLEREIGRGGMGIVFRARDVALDRVVAIKVLPFGLGQEPEAHARFLREARTAAGLFHPNIVPVHSVEEHDNFVFFVMSCVEGESLGSRVRRVGPLMPAAVTRMLQEVAWALGYAHQRGVIHRDIKPDNILLDRASGRALVTDFGIARVLATPSVSLPGEIVGSVHFMSPEQGTGEPVDARSDIYSLGVTAFFALTGRLPFEGPNSVAVIHRHISEPPPRVASVATDAPAGLAEAVDKCLAKDPLERFGSGDELAATIGDAASAPLERPPQVRTLVRGIRAMGGYIGAALVGPFVINFSTSKLMDIWAHADGFNKVFDGTIAAVLAFAVFVEIPSFLWRAARDALINGYDLPYIREVLAAEGRALLEEERVRRPTPSILLVFRALGKLRLRRRDASAPRARHGFGSLDEILLLDKVFLGLGAIALVTVAFGSPKGPDALLAACWILLIGLVLRGAGPRVAPDSPLRMLGLGERMLIGRFGALVFRLASIGLRRSAPAAGADHARTEAVIASAADGLFERLPPALRVRFEDVPAVIGRLQENARLLRQRERQLADALALVELPVGAAAVKEQRTVRDDLEARRFAARTHLASTVAMLENLRLDILRLTADVGSPDDLTADLERARAVGQAVDAELAARRELAELLSTPSDHP